MTRISIPETPVTGTPKKDPSRREFVAGGVAATGVAAGALMTPSIARALPPGA